MKKWLTWLFTLSLGLTLLLAGCTLTEKKEITGEPLDFTVVPAEDVPELEGEPLDPDLWPEASASRAA